MNPKGLAAQPPSAFQRHIYVAYSRIAALSVASIFLRWGSICAQFSGCYGAIMQSSAGEKRKRADGGAAVGGLAAKKEMKKEKQEARVAKLMDRRFGDRAPHNRFRGGGRGGRGGRGGWGGRGGGRGNGIRRQDFRQHHNLAAAAAAEDGEHTKQAQTRFGPHFTSPGAASTKINDEWQVGVRPTRRLSFSTRLNEAPDDPGVSLTRLMNEAPDGPGVHLT